MEYAYVQVANGREPSKPEGEHYAHHEAQR